MKTTYLLLKYLAILLWSSFVALPFLWALTTSFKTANGVTGGATYLPWLQYEPSLEGWKVLVRTGGQGIDIVAPYHLECRGHSERQPDQPDARNAGGLWPVALHVPAGVCQEQ